MILIIIFLLSYLLEITLKYYLPFLPDFFIYLEPMFFVSSLIIYIILFHKKKKSIYFVLANSLIYDLFFGNILFLYTLIFLILYYIISFICKQLKRYLLTDILLLIGSLILFILLKYIILLWIGYNHSLIFLLNEVLHSIIINSIYGSILYYFLGIKSKKA